MTRTSDTQIELYDAQGRLIGAIVRPVSAEALGPGREKVFLRRRPAPRPERGPRTSQAA